MRSSFATSEPTSATSGPSSRHNQAQHPGQIPEPFRPNPGQIGLGYTITIRRGRPYPQSEDDVEYDDDEAALPAAPGPRRPGQRQRRAAPTRAREIPATHGQETENLVEDDAPSCLQCRLFVDVAENQQLPSDRHPLKCTNNYDKLLPRRAAGLAKTELEKCSPNCCAPDAPWLETRTDARQMPEQKHAGAFLEQCPGPGGKH